MEAKSKKFSRRKILERIIVIFCATIFVSVIFVLSFIYEPKQNALVALGTVCMDVISIIVLIMLVANLVLERALQTKTTRLFLCLMLATMVALFFDFLTWAMDGALAYHDITYVYIISSLTMGSVLAAIFIIYLASYLDSMYGLKMAVKLSKICLVCNVFAYFFTWTLALTGNAFIIEDGHYKTGSLYDLVTVIPVATVFLMTGYCIANIKTIGIRDLIAVVGYILTMITGALIEAAYGVGTTYVGITIADIFIFVMLQNKVLNRFKKQNEALDKKIVNQYNILESMAGIYSHVNYVDLKNKTVRKLDFSETVNEKLDLSKDPHSDLNKNLYENIIDEHKESFLAYTDLSTLASRMKNEKIISAEFRHKDTGWFRAQYIRIGDSVSEPLSLVIYAIRNIDEEKKNVEKWIKKSNTDELTGLLNRHAYEDEITKLKKDGLRDNFVYFSFDVNGLKVSNDSLGHEAGDELLLGASECIKQCFGSYGNVYRTGGDEFVAMIYTDSERLEKIVDDFKEKTSSWAGKYIESITISCGYVQRKDAADLSLHQIAVMADKKMYEDKTKYYQKKGVDRRGQTDAHVALCALFTKILRINITKDSYQIVNVDAREQTADKGFSDTISQWFINFGLSGQVHPEDLANYNANTDLEFLSSYFKMGNSSLKVFYRRKYEDDYKQVMLEMIPANDYTDVNQTLYLYVKEL